MEQRDQILKKMKLLCQCAIEMKLPTKYITVICEEIVANEGGYDPVNLKADWGQGNNRYRTSLLGEYNATVYTMHLWTTLPPWVEIELLTERTDQYEKALDARIDGKTTVQIKTGHEGKSGDIYVHPDWLRGEADLLVAVCGETRCFHQAPLATWKQLAKEYMSMKAGSGGMWIYRQRFIECGGEIITFNEKIQRIV